MTTIHIHSCLLASHRSLLMSAAECLSAEELKRGSRFKASAARDEFLLSRLLLRRILAGHLQRTADHVVLSFNPYGKPVLDLPGQACVEFNISHSHGRLLIAVCQGFPVGIDIEKIDYAIDPILMAQNGLLHEDLEQLQAAAANDRHGLFFRLWTRREAYLKALGKGFLAVSETVSKMDSGNGILVRKVPDSAHCVVIQDLPIAPDFKAAVALVSDAGPPEALHIEWHSGAYA